MDNFAKLLANAHIEMTDHPTYGRVASWPSLRRNLKGLLPQLGARLHREITLTPVERGVIVHARVTITIGDERVIGEGAAFASWSQDPASKRFQPDPIRPAVTAASRSALEFILLAGSAAEDDFEDAPIVELVDKAPIEVVEPSAADEEAEPVDEAPGELAQPETQAASESVGKAPRSVSKTSGRRVSARTATALALEVAKLSSAARRQFIADVKSLTGRADIDSLPEEKAIRASQRLETDTVRRIYEWWTTQSPEDRANWIAEIGEPWIFNEDDDVLHIFEAKM